MRKLALLIGVSTYQEGLEALPSAVKDVVAMQQVLTHPEIGEFAETDVKVLSDPDRQAMSDAIYTLFATCQKDDLVLLYFSGHGILDRMNEFYFSTSITRKVQGQLVPTTALPANDIRGWMEQSQSQRKVIILDSCFSGAFAKGVKAKDSGSINPEQFLGGKGTAILTASTSTQYALTQEGFDLSIYTHFLVEGMRTGGADRNNNGRISVEDLHTYAKEKVQEAAPAMTPEFYPFRDGGHQILLVKSPTNDPRLRYRKEVKDRAYQGTFTIPARQILNALQTSLPLDAAIAAEIEAEVLKPYQEFQRKLREYEETLVETVKQGDLSDQVLNDLKDYQTFLGLRDEDVQRIHDRILAPKQADYQRQLAQQQEQERLKQQEAVEQQRQEQERLEQLRQQEVERSKRQKAEQLRQSQQPIAQPETITVELQSPGFLGFSSKTILLEMVKIPGGQFQMGTAVVDRDKIIQEYVKAGKKQADAERWTDWEIPQHQVTITPFYLGKYPVTQAQWKAIAALPKIKQDLNPNPANFKGDNLPIEQVSWLEAIEFCDRLSQKTGRTYRLPSEAEWEYACRAGTTTPFYFGETISTDLANYDGNYTYGDGKKGEYRKKTTPVGQFSANAFGLYDMHGNVWEWCFDHWHENYGGAPIDGSAWLTNDDNLPRLLRGGSWGNNPLFCRSAIRNWYTPDFCNYSFGFRVVLVA